MTVDEAPETTKENIDQADFWAQIGWAPIGEDTDQNMDLVPSHFDTMLESGCPECQSVWAELLAIGFTSERTHAGDAKWNGSFFGVTTRPTYHRGDRAVRVRCAADHVFDFDSYTKRVRKFEPPNWALIGVGMISVYLLGSALGLLKKGGG